MTKMRRLGALFLLLALLAGCSEEESGFTWSNAEGTSQAAPSASPRPLGDTLRLSMPVAGGVWDPALNTSQAMQGLMQLVYEPLMRLDGAQRPADSLAESWQSADGGLTWTFLLRQGVYFHDGSAFSAQDCVRALDRIAEVGDEGAYGWILRDIAGWRAVDERTLEITAAQPGYGVLYSMVFPVFKVLGEGFPVGTGPYRLGQYLTEESLSLDQNQSWWRAAPSIKAIRVQARGSNESELSTFLLGEFDLVRSRSVTATLYREAGVSASQEYMTQSYDALFFNFRKPMMADPRLRQAIAQAVDRQDLIVNIYQNHAVASEVPVPPDSWLHVSAEAGTPSQAAAFQALEDMGFVDVDADGTFELKPQEYAEEPPEDEDGTSDEEDVMREILGETPLPEETPNALISSQATVGEPVARGLYPLVLLTNYEQDNPIRRDAALRLAQQLVGAGLPVTVDAVPLADIPARLEAGDYDMALLGYQIPGSCDLRFLFSAASESPQAGHLVTGYRDAQLERLMEALPVARDEAAYHAAVQAVAARLLAELPCIGLYFRTGTVLFREELTLPGVLREDKPYAQIEGWLLAQEEDIEEGMTSDDGEPIPQGE